MRATSLSTTATSSVSLNSDITKAFEPIKATLSLSQAIKHVINPRGVFATFSFISSSNKQIRKYFTLPLTINTPAIQSNMRVQLVEEQSTSFKNIHKIFMVRIQKSRLSKSLKNCLWPACLTEIFCATVVKHYCFSNYFFEIMDWVRMVNIL